MDILTKILISIAIMQLLFWNNRDLSVKIAICLFCFVAHNLIIVLRATLQTS